MQNAYAYKLLRYKYQGIYARIEIQEFFLKTIVWDIHENVGQVLSLVRIQLAMLALQGKEIEINSIAASGDLIEKCIKDLRRMCQKFYIDNEILEGTEWLKALEHTVEVLYSDSASKLKVANIPAEMDQSVRCILFRILQELLISIKDSDGEFTALTVSFSSSKVKAVIDYKGQPINWCQGNDGFQNGNAFFWVNFKERLELIKGKITVKVSKNDIIKTTLIAPLNSYKNE